MKKIKMLALLLSGSIVLSCGAGCGSLLDDPINSTDSGTKTILKVGIFNGDFGTDWLTDMELSFEERYSSYSFEEGKTGIDVQITPGNAEMQETQVIASMGTSGFDMYWGNYKIRNFNLQGKVANITDVVTNSMAEKYAPFWSDLGETQTIAEKMNADVKNYVLYADAGMNGVPSGDYYGIPWYFANYGLAYDVDLFYEEGFYVDANGNFIAGTNGDKSKEAAVDEQKSVGQDGIKGTYDDGLPVTYDDFKDLIARMGSDITPMIWCATTTGYRRGYLASFWANYEGASDFRINVTASGVDSTLGEITPATGYKLMDQAGRLKTLEFVEDVIRNNWFDISGQQATSNREAQDKFLNSKYNAEAGSSDRIAMLMEGIWWEKGASQTLKDMEKYGDEYKNRRFGLMTYPRMDENASKDGMVLVSSSPDMNIIINKATRKFDAAAAFLLYTTTDECMAKTTVNSGAPRPYKYSISGDLQKEMSFFKRCEWSYFRDAVQNNRIVYTSNAGEFSAQNPRAVEDDFGFKKACMVKGELISYNNAFTAFYDNPSLTATDFAAALKTAVTDGWSGFWGK